MTPAAITLIALVCQFDAATGRHERDCGSYTEPRMTLAECKERAAWLRATSPAGVRVVMHTCFRPKGQQQ